MIRSVAVDREESSLSLAGPAAGERALLRALLEDAVNCATGEGGSARTRVERAAEARDWFASEDRQWPFSFENICDVFDIPADTLRRNLREDPVAVARAFEGEAVKRPPPVRRDVREEIVRQIQAGQPQRHIARTLGVSLQLVARLATVHAGARVAERDAEVRRLRRRGWTLTALAARFEVARGTIVRICNPGTTPPPGTATGGAPIALAAAPLA